MSFFKNLSRSLAVPLAVFALLPLSVQAKGKKSPPIFAPYLEKDKPVVAEMGMIVTPKEINKYFTKMQEAAKADPKWYQAYMKTINPDLPLPYHEKLGLTKSEYDEYIKLWRQRKFQPVQKVFLRLEEVKPGEWMIRASGAASPISLLRYFTKTDTFHSTNGVMKRLKDFNMGKDSIWGAWKGHEWQFEAKSEFEWTRENIKIGKYIDNSNCLLIYRITERISGYNKSAIIRFSVPSKKKSSKRKSSKRKSGKRK